MTCRSPVWVGLLLACAATTPAAGQEAATRAEALRQARETKQQSLRPYEPNALERAMHVAEDRVVPLLQRDGLFARLGSLRTSSGFAYGGGYRDRSLVNSLGSLFVWGAASLKRYWALEARAHYPLAPGGDVGLEGYVRRDSSPQEEYFGPGPASRRADRSTYSERGTTAGVGVTARVIRPLTAGTTVEVRTVHIGSGARDDLPSVEERFAASDIPGFGAEATFLRSSAFVELDYRQPINARKGGWYRLDVTRVSDRAARRSSFTQTTLDLRQYVSFLAERRVLAGRVWVATTDAAAGHEVPFYLLPALGGNDTLRGFRALRFRGPHAILLQAEYRWEIWSGLDAALFYDAGKVTGRRADLNLRTLERDYGFGFRFNTDDGVIMRVDAAFGSRDGRHLHVVFGGIF